MNHPNRNLTSGTSNINKRKFEFDAVNKPKPPFTSKIPKFQKPGFLPPPPASNKPVHYNPVSSNLLLAGYLAHEFLTKGTLFGEQWDPARAEAVSISAAAESKRMKTKAEPNEKAEPTVEKRDRYVEVASLLKRDGAHIPGIVNPTQLAMFLHM